MKARLLILAAAAVSLSGCDFSAPFRALSAEQPVGEVQFTDIGTASVQSATSITMDVEFFDKASNVIDTTGRAVEWTSSDPAIAIVTGNAASATIEGKKVGTATITATINGHSAARQVIVTPGAPAKLVKVSGDNQLGIINENLLANLVVQVTDVNDNAVSLSTQVSWQFNNGTPLTFFTNSSGQSAVVLTPRTLGAGTETATLNATQASVSFTLTVTTMELGVVTGPPATATQGVVVTPSPVIELRYASDHSAYKRSGVFVSASRLGTNGPTVNGSATSDANGRATFTNLTLSGAAGAATIVFTSSSPSATVNSPTQITLSAGAATKIALTSTLASATVSGQALPVAPVIQIEDANGNAVAQAGVQVTAAIASGTGFTFVSGTNTATTDATGKATFSTLAVQGTLGGAFALSFSTTTSLTGISSTGFISLTGPAATLGITVVPSTVTCASTNSITLQVKDNAGRAVALPNLQIAASISSGATIGGTVNATTDINGKATFSGMTFQTASAVSYTLTFTPAAPSTLAPVNATVSITAGNATKLKITTEPSTTVAVGAVMATVPVVRLLDVCDLPVSTNFVQVTVSLVSGTGVTFNPATVNTSNGVATFTGLTMVGPVSSNYKLQFTSANLTTATAVANTALTVGAPTKVALTTATTITSPSNVAFTPQPAVQLRDAGNNDATAAATTVTATINGTAIGTATTSATTGAATFSNLKYTSIAGSYNIVFTATGIPGTATATLTLAGAGTASKLGLTTQPQTAAINGLALAQTPVVQLQDATGTAVSLAGITVTAGTGSFSSSVSGGSAVTDATGKATFPSLTLTGAGQSPTLTFSASGLTNVAATSSTLIATALAKGVAASIPATTGGVPVYYGVNVAGVTATPLTISVTNATSILIYQNKTDAPGIPANLCSATGTNPKVCTIATPTNGQYFIAVVPSVNITSGSSLITVNW